ncbi:hypothetical protein FRB93_011116 [Tulasnella sp. JGI-2019a]|nr:hypothetical protein FRB93_011116 [Tulasnella sp. JGI-2019a]
MLSLSLLGGLLLLASSANAFPPVQTKKQLAPTPPMGWNTWNHFHCNISEEVIRGAMETFMAYKLQDFGYEYIIIDDCWQAPARDPDSGAPLVDPVQFPLGMKHLSDRAHELGLKFGMYSSAGIKTCAGRFGSLGYEEIDAKAYAAWGVDYFKYDNCWNEGRHGSQEISFERYSNMSNALLETGRPITYAMCNWGEDASWEWATEIAHSWRIYGDVSDEYDGYDKRCPCEPSEMYTCTYFGYRCSVARILEWAAPLHKYARNGGWNDLDMLEVGNGNMTYDEYVTHFSMWALLKSPLILGNNLPKMTPEDLSIVTNREIIRINQDPLGIPARRIWKKSIAGGDLQLWFGPLSDHEHVVALWNNSPEPLSTTISFSDLFEDYDNMTAVQAWDLWWPRESHVHQVSFKGLLYQELTASLRTHQTGVWRIRWPKSDGPTLIVQPM